MKKIINLSKIVFSILLISQFFVGCLDLKEDIKNAEDQDFSAPLEDLNNIVRPAYASLRDRNLYNVSGFRISWEEVGVDAWSIPTRRINPVHNNTFTSQNADVNNVWVSLYSAIRICNDVINNIDELGENSVTNEQRRDLYAQARFVRAILYFNLVKIYENPVISDPRVVDDASVITSVIPNSTPGEVYQLIQNDLIYAINSLDPNNTGSVIATVDAAKAMLGKVYVQIAGMMINDVNIEPISFALIGNNEESIDSVTGEPEEVAPGVASSTPLQIYGQAVSLLGQVINSGKFRLLESYRDIFDPNSDADNNEVIFKVDFVPDGADNGSGYGDFAVGLGGGLPFGVTGSSRTNGREGIFSYYDTRLTDDRIFRKVFANGVEFPLPISDGRFLVNHFTYGIGQYNKTRDPNTVQKNRGVVDVWSPAKWIKGPDATMADVGNRDFDYPIIRYADVLLLRAEALIYSGKQQAEAISLINQVRRRAYGIDEGATTTNENSVDKLYFTREFHNKGAEVFTNSGNETIEEKVKEALIDLKAAYPDELGSIDVLALFDYYVDNFRTLIANKKGGAQRKGVDALPTIRPINGELHEEFRPTAILILEVVQREIDAGLPTSIPMVDLNNVIDGFSFFSTKFTPLVEDSVDFEELKFILSQERRKEFENEGHRKDDLIRFGAIDDVVSRVAEPDLMPSRYSSDYIPQIPNGAATYPNKSGQNSDRKPNEGWQPFRYRWPIPSNELDLNPLLRQNTGY